MSDIVRVTRVDIPAVDGTMDNLDAITDRFEKAVDTIKSLAAELRGCWGDDEFGQKFAGQYVPDAEELLVGADDSVTALRDLEENLRKIAQMFEALDAHGGGVLKLEAK